MKTNLWKLSCMALAMAAIVTGCNQNNELGTPAPSGEEDVLNVVATANDFVSSDATSRVSETDYTTTFEEGDAIGVFVVRDGEALVSNMKMTLGADGTTWAGENDAKLYYYKDADYIAYSPYTEGLSVTSEEEIITHFTTNLKNSTGQSTLAEYQAADLMTASVVAANVTRGQNITFSFAHKMSMIEIKVPIRAYTSGDYEYSAPLGLKVTMAEESAAGKEFSLCTFGKETITENESEVTKGLYRCIVAPSNTELNVEGEFQDGSVPVYFPAANGAALSVTPKAGEYEGIDVKYDYADHSGIEERNLEVGDYYYADGSIWPGDLGNVPAGCIGIIFSTETSTADQAKNWSHGYVVSLFDTDDINTKYSWSMVNEDITGLNLYEKTVDSFTSAFADYDGYSATQAILAAPSYSAAAYAAVNAAVTYGKEIPSTTSGWYLPSIGQVALIINNLGVANGTQTSKMFTPQNAMEGLGGGKFDEKSGAPEAMLALQQTLQEVGGEFYYYPIAESQSYGYRWWTSSGVQGDNTKAWSIDTNSYKFLLYDASKSETGNMHVRPVFAF